MTDEQPQPAERFRVFLDGDWIPKGDLTIAFGPRVGMFCTLDGQDVKVSELICDLSSGEIQEIHLERASE